jgi:Mn2+/Fe2+ NRAMP family transporter
VVVPDYHASAAHLSVPVHRSGPGSAARLVVSLVGTTVAPWQLFFQQSYVVDKRISAPCASRSARLRCSTRSRGRPSTVRSSTSALRHSVGSWAGPLFAVLLLDGSILGAAAVTLATSYAVGEVAGTEHSMHRRWRDARCSMAATRWWSFSLPRSC